MIYSRQTTIKLKYNGKDITSDLTPYLKGFSFSDPISGMADDLQIKLEDRGHIWENEWFPGKEDTLNASIIMKNYDETGVPKELPLGNFEIDEITSSGAPSEIDIKAVSVPNNTTLRGVAKNRSWEKAKLSVIAQDIADGADLTLIYDTEYDKKLERAEQTEQSDLEFLNKLCQDAGLALKVTNDQIVILDEKEYEAAEPVMTIVRDDLSLAVNTTGDSVVPIAYNLRSSIRDVYYRCDVKYSNTKKKKSIEGSFTAPNKTKGKVLVINEQVETIAEANQLAEKKLREKNREEFTGSFNLMGQIKLAASLTVKILGYGAFDGKYIITNAKHVVGSGYTTNIDIRRCLDGY